MIDQVNSRVLYKLINWFVHCRFKCNDFISKIYLSADENPIYMYYICKQSGPLGTFVILIRTYILTKPKCTICSQIDHRVPEALGKERRIFNLFRRPHREAN